MAYINGKEILFSSVIGGVAQEDFDKVKADLRTLLQVNASGGITIPKEVTKVRGYAFYRHTTLSGVELHDLLTSIDDYAFGYTGIKNITIPNSVSFIGKYCFRDCAELEGVKMSKKVNNIATSTFINCTNCIRYDFSEHESVPSLAATDAFNKINENAEIVIPYNLYSEWIAATNWASLASHIITKVTPEQIYFLPSNDIAIAAKVGEAIYWTIYFGGEEGLTFGKQYLEYSNGTTKEIHELSGTVTGDDGVLVTMGGTWFTDQYSENGKNINGEVYAEAITFHKAGTYRFFQRFIDSRGAEFSTAAYVFEVTE